MMLSSLTLAITVIGVIVNRVNGQDTLGFIFKGVSYPNDDYILLSDVGEGDDTLICTTTRSDCCTANSDSNIYFPNGNLVPARDAVRSNGMYISRGDQQITLGRVSSFSSNVTGLYSCEIPDSSGNENNIIRINIIRVDVHPITSSVTGTESRLTCMAYVQLNSFGGASTITPNITWLDGNNMTVPSGDGDTRMVSTVMSSGSTHTSTVQFDTLQSSHAGMYTCQVAIGSTSVTQSVEVITVGPPPTMTVTIPSGTLYAGTPATLICVITVDDTVMSDVEIDVSWTPSNDRISVQNTTGTSPTFTSTVTVSPLSSADTDFTCRALIRPPSGSGLVTASGQGMDTTEVTVQVPPFPSADITVTGTSTAGEPHSLTCRVTVVENLIQPPTVMWTGPGVGQSNVEITGPIVSGPVTTLTLSFSPLHTSHGGQYTCTATLDIPNAGVFQLTSMAAQDMAVNIPSITIRIGGNDPIAGQSYSLTSTVSGADQLNPIITYQWFNTNRETQVGTNSSTLSFTPLTLSSAGQYKCHVTVSSPYLSQDINETSNVQDLIIMIPSPVVSVVFQSPVFVGSSPSLTCNIELSEAVDIEVTVNAVWSGPSGTQLTTTTPAVLVSGTTYTSTATLSSVETSDSGVYTCTATVSPQASLFITASNGSRTETITIVPAPSHPMVVLTTSQSTSITISWIQPQDDVVESYNISYSYLGPCDDVSQSENITLHDGNRREFTAEGLHEFSNYSITIIAVNQVGASDTVSVTAATLPSAPSGRPQSLTVTSTTPTTITVQWDEVECVEQNSEITGYTVRYEAVISNMRESTTRTFTATGLIPRTNYTFEVAATSVSGSGPSTMLNRTTQVYQSVGFYLNGQLYGNNSIVTLDEIGEDSAALLCLTNKTDCCSISETGSDAIGNWFFPNSTIVTGLVMDSAHSFYSKKGPSVVQLHRTNDDHIAGVFQCDIQDTSGATNQLFIGVFSETSGLPVITDTIVLDRNTLTLICTSTGGPATTVVWMRNGVVVEVDDTNYQQSQRVLSAETATYENVLSSNDISNFIANFSCCIGNLRGSSCKNVTLNGVLILGSSEVLNVGEMHRVTCISDVSASAIEWFDSQGSVVASVASMNQLDLMFNPVNDSIHNTDYTCRVTRQDGTATSSTTITTVVPPHSLSAAITTSGSAVAGGMYSLQCDISITIPGLANIPTAIWIGLNGSPVTSGGSVTITSNSAATSILTFNSLTTSQAGGYTCEGSIESPALESPQTIREIEEVDVQIPTPNVMVDVPSGTLYAGTNITLTCTITVDDPVNTDVEVDVTWTPSSDRLNIQTTTGSRPSFTSTVTVSPLSSADTGFTCSAVVRPPSGDSFVTASSPGMDTEDITVQAPPPPAVDITNTGTSTAGDPYSLTCRVTVIENLIQPPTLMWTGPGVGETDVEITGPVVSGTVIMLTIGFSSLHTSYGGQYACSILLDIPTASFLPLSNRASQDVNVQIPLPSLTIEGRPVNEGFLRGEPLDLICHIVLDDAVDSTVTVSTSWTKDGVPVSGGIDTGLLDSPQQQYQSMIFLGFLRNSDSGEFLCSVLVVPQDSTYITGISNSVTRSIQVGATPPPNVTVHSNGTSIAGHEHMLVCTAVREERLALTMEMEWFGPLGDPIIGMGTIVSGVQITENATITRTLTFDPLYKIHEGEYTCRVNTILTGETEIDHITSKVVSVIVKDMLEFIFQGAYYPNNSYILLSEIRAGDDTLICTTTRTDCCTGNNTAGEFHFPNGNLVPTRDVVRSNGMYIERHEQHIYLSRTPNPSSTVFGLYCCNLPDSNGNSQSMCINIVNDLPPVFTPPTRVINVSSITSSGNNTAGQHFSLTCTAKVEGSYVPTITWLDGNSMTVPSGGSDTRMVSTVISRGSIFTSVLQFDPLQLSHSGMYTCQVSVLFRTTIATTSTDVTVVIPTPSVMVDIPTSVLYAGTLFMLSCNISVGDAVDTDVEVDVTWSPSSDRLNIQTTTGSRPLFTNTATLSPLSSDDTIFTCSAVLRPPPGNSFVTASSEGMDTVNITVRIPPPPVLNITIAGTSTAGDLYCLTCIASVVENLVQPPIISWTGPGVGQSDVDFIGPSVSNSVTNLTLSFTPLYMKYEGEYTCRAVIDIPNAGFVSLTDITTQNITVKVPSVTVMVNSSNFVSENDYFFNCTVSGAYRLNPITTYQWFKTDPETHVGINSSILLFNQLRLSYAGQYGCYVTVSSTYLSEDIRLMSDTENLWITTPGPELTISSPSPIFVGSSPTLICIIRLDELIDIEVNLHIEWNGPSVSQFTNTTPTVQLTNTTYVSKIILSSVEVNDSGVYTCVVAVSPQNSSFVISSDEKSVIENITIVPAPSNPVFEVITIHSNSIGINWTKPHTDIVDTYKITYHYIGPCSGIDQVHNTTFIDGNRREYTAEDLHEFSNYTITITAINGAGESQPISRTVTTLPAAPSGRPQSLTVTSTTPTTITIKWDEVECIEQNGEITGYIVRYGGVTSNVSESTTRTFIAAELTPRTNYTFEVESISNSGRGPSAVVSMETAIPESVGFFLNGQLYGNNSIVTLDEIGEDNAALLCLTNKTDCCSSVETGSGEIGNWFFPNGGSVSSFSIDSDFYGNRGPSVVRLHRRNNAQTIGVFHCRVDNLYGKTLQLYVGVYPVNSGTPSITDVVFDRSSLTLTCSSTGGPATNVTWMKNGVVVEVDDTNYQQSQRVMNTETATFENFVSSNDIANLVGNFTCTTINIRGSSTANISLEGVRILGNIQSLLVGGVSSIRCVSDDSANVIEWLNSEGSVVASVTSAKQLDLIFNPVNDNIHNKDYTCRVTRQDWTVTQTVTITVNVPSGSLMTTIITSGSAVAGRMYSLQCDISTTIPGLANIPTATWIGPSGNPVNSNGSVTIRLNTAANSILTFSPLMTSQGGGYICEGSIESPALESPQTVREIMEVQVQIPPPNVGIEITRNGTSVLFAGVLLPLLCTMTVDAAINTDINVDVTWTPSSNQLNISTTTGSRPSFTSTVTVSPLSSTDTGFTCSAVITPLSGSRFITASTPGTDTEEVSVHVPPNPTVDTLTVGLPIIGDPFNLTCIVTVVEDLIQPPTVIWTGPGVGQTNVEITGPIVSGPVTTLTLSFSPLLTIHEGQYTCAAVLDLPNAGFTLLTNKAIHTIVAVDPLIQLRLIGVDDCDAWVGEQTSAKSAEVADAVTTNIARRCQCDFTIRADGFRCFPDSTTAVVYRAEVHGNGQTTASEVVVNLEDWISGGAGIFIQSLFIHVDSSCGVLTRSVGEECPPHLNRESSSTDPSNEPVTTHNVQAQQPEDDSDGIIVAAIATSGTVLVVVLIVITVAVIVIATLILRYKKTAIKNITRDDESQVPSAVNTVALTNVIHSGEDNVSYYEDLTKYNKADAQNLNDNPLETQPQQSSTEFGLTRCLAYRAPSTVDEPTPDAIGGHGESVARENERVEPNVSTLINDMDDKALYEELPEEDTV